MPPPSACEIAHAVTAPSAGVASGPCPSGTTPAGSTASSIPSPAPSSRPSSASGGASTSTAPRTCPTSGPAIMCPNHTSVIDSFFLPLGPAAAHHVRRQGRVHRRLEDEAPLPGPRHDPDRPSGGDSAARGPSTRRPACSSGASCSASTPRAPAAATASCTRATPARPAWRCARARRSSRSASRAPATSSRRTPALPGRSGRCEIRFGRPISVDHYARPRRRPPRAARDHRRGDVRDPGAVAAGVRRRVRHRRRPTSLPAQPTPIVSRDRRQRQPGRRRAPVGRVRIGLTRRRTGSGGSATGRYPRRPWPTSRSRSRTVPTRQVAPAPPRATWPVASVAARPRRRSSPTSTASERDLGTELADGDHVAIVTADTRAGPVHDPPLDGPRAGPGGARPVPRGHVRHRPAGRGRLLLRLRAAGRRHVHRPTTSSASTPACARSSPSTSRSCATRSPADEARELFADHPFKLEIIDDASTTRCRRTESGARPHLREPAGQAQGPAAVRTGARGFIDLCRGPARRRTRAGTSATSSCMRVAGAYWRGDEKQPAAPAHLRHGVGVEEGPRRRTSTGSRRPPSATTASSAPSSTCSASRRARRRPARSGTPRAASSASSWRTTAGPSTRTAGYEFVYTPHIAKGELFETSGPPRLLRRRHVPARWRWTRGASTTRSR